MQSTILDDFADLSGWMAVASGLAELRISPDRGPAGAVLPRVARMAARSAMTT
jgi:hypothetical protein